MHLHFQVDILRKLGGLLHQCSKTKSYSDGLSLHAFLIKHGSDNDLFICNHLINLYAKCNNFHSAHKIFDSMHEHNLISWSSLISGYDQAGKHSLAIDLFTKMKLQPNEFIYSSILTSCGSLLAIRQGKQVHAHALVNDYTSISFVFNSLISMYMKCGCFDNAFLVFANLPKPYSIAYNAMIKGFSENSQFEKGLSLFKLMKQQGLHTDRFSYTAVLEICTEVKDIELCAALHGDTIKVGLNVMTFVGNVILTMYAKCGTIIEVEKAFDSIMEKDVITCNTFVAACSHSGEHAKGSKLFKEMENVFGVCPDDFTLTSVLSACAALAHFRYGAQIHAHLIRRRVSFDVGVGNAIINMYAKCGLIGYANRLFHHMPEKNLFSWNTILVALGNHGFGNMAVDTFDMMKNKRVMPDDVTFVALLTACSHVGLVEEGLACFDSMKGTYHISPKIEHLSCLIDLLGRAGRLEEAETYLKTSVHKNDLIIWASLLSSCRIHNDVLVGERAARKLLELQPTSSSPYIIMSNLYASDKKWEEAANARNLLKGSGVKKEPGHSLISIKDIPEKFTVGDFSHVRIVKIVETLKNSVSLSQSGRAMG